MAIAVYFHPASMNAAQYDDTIRRLDAAGAGKPKGRLYHASFGEGSGLMVFDVWESQADFDAFGQTLMPILAEIGLDSGQPQVMPLHNSIKG